jgi:DNA invertase Pin-like site-specific DNA recombinase
MKRKPVTRVALYARVSTATGQQDVTNQLFPMRTLAKNARWKVVHEYIEHASGKSSARPVFKKMLEAAHSHEFDLVLFWSLDRFSREGVLQTLQHLQQLTQDGIAYRSLTENFIDSSGPFRDVIISLLACVAKMERERISERVHAGLARARREGKHIGRPARIVSLQRMKTMREMNHLSDAEIGKRLGVSRMTVARRLAVST